MEEALSRELKKKIGEGFGISTDRLISKQQVLAALSARIEQLMAADADLLFSLLYRLDISERKIKEVLKGGSEIALHLATLVYDRQLEKAAWRNHFKPDQPDDELAW